MKFQLTEDLFNLPQTDIQPELFDNQLASQLRDLITDRFDIIDKLDNFKSYIIQGKQNNELLPIIDNILNDDNKHIGELQEMLKTVSDEAENISVGEDEAAEILS